MQRRILLFLIFFTKVSIFPFDIHKAGEFICSRKEKLPGLEIAIFPFTNLNGEENKETKKIQQQFITELLKCKDLVIIDQKKVNEVLEQQSKLQSGLYGNTEIQLGQLTGAKTLLYGTYENHYLQISLIDAEKGTVIGAYHIEETEGKSISHQEAKMQYQNLRLRRHLEFLYRKRPILFLYVVTSEEELKRLQHKNPHRFRRFMERIRQLQSHLPAKRKEELELLREEILRIRHKDPRFNHLLIQKRRKLIKKIRKKHLRQSNGFPLTRTMST